MSGITIKYTVYLFELFDEKYFITHYQFQLVYPTHDSIIFIRSLRNRANKMIFHQF